MQLTLICGRKSGRGKAILSGGSRLDVDVSIDWLGDSMVIDVRDAAVAGTLHSAKHNRQDAMATNRRACPHWSKREADKEPVDLETFQKLRESLTQADLGERLLVRGITIGRITSGQTKYVDRKLNAAARELLDSLG